jgi:hypothetical protein
MAIPDISVRPSLVSSGTTLDLSAPVLSTQTNLDTSSVASLLPPASTQDLSTGGLFMGLLTQYGNEHPEEAKAFLQGVASTLRAYSEQQTTSLISLSSWADRFQQAAETGDLSQLTPQVTPASSFGLRAYQAAQPLIEDPTELLRSVPPPAGDVTTPNMLEALSQELVELSTSSVQALSTLAGGANTVTTPAAVSGDTSVLDTVK